MKLRTAFLTTLLLLTTLVCVKTTGANSVAGTTPAQSHTTPAQTDLASYFKPFPAGAFVLYDLKQNAYVRYNEAFATALADEAAPGARVMIQDYHLALAPRILRKLRADVRIRVKRLRNARRQRVNLNSCDGRAAENPLRHEADEMADAGRGFENSAALKAEPLQGAIHRTDDDRCSVMGVERR